MPRIARVVALGYPHHITQRGNYKQKVFFKNSDYSRYLKRLNEYCCKYKLLILAYCLMPNHVHFIAVPEEESSLAKTFNTCHMCYSQFLNKRNGVKGHLWQGRFFSSILDEKYLFAAIRYIENNPVRARIVNEAADWKWSSARAHLGKVKDSLLFEDIKKFIEINDWKKYLAESDDEEIIQSIKINTLSGKPLGSETFLSELEKITGVSFLEKRLEKH